MSIAGGDPFPGCCTCGHATHVGDNPPPCRCFRPALGPPVAPLVPFPALPSRRPLHADITALECRLAEEYANVEFMEYEVGGCRVTISRSADGFSVTLRRKP